MNENKIASQSQAAQPSELTIIEETGLAELANRVIAANDEPIAISTYAAVAIRKLLAAHLAGQSQATRAVPDLHGAIMNLPCKRTMSHFATRHELSAYKEGHLDALLAAVEWVTAQEVTQQAAKAETAERMTTSDVQFLAHWDSVCDGYGFGTEFNTAFKAAEAAWNAARRFRAQGGSTNDKGSDLAPTTSTVSAAEEVRNLAIEEVAKLIEKKIYAYNDECGSYDHSTGVTEYPGNGEEWVGEMGELAEEIRALKRTTSGKGEAA